MAQMELDRREELLARARRVESATSQQDTQQRVRQAMATPAHWLQNHTRTFNPHWLEENALSPYESFPLYQYFELTFEIFDREPVTGVAKSRDMMVSWGCVGYFLYQALNVPEREIVFQTLEGEKVEQLIDYARTLYHQQDDFLKDAFPLVRDTARALVLANGAQIIGIPGGASKIRSLHPWGYYNDETTFQPDAGACYNEALGTGAQKLVLSSSAGIGWFSDWKKDVVK